MEYFWNDGGKTKYYLVIFDQLQGHSGELIRAPESCVRGPLISVYEESVVVVTATTLLLK